VSGECTDLETGTVTQIISDENPKLFATLMTESETLRKQLDRLARKEPYCKLHPTGSPSLIAMSVAALDQYVPPLLTASASMDGGYYASRLRAAVGTWDSYRGKVTSGSDVLGTGASIAEQVHNLAKELVALPAAASDENAHPV